jgi:hypothetical protein
MSIAGLNLVNVETNARRPWTRKGKESVRGASSPAHSGQLETPIGLNLSNRRRDINQLIK